MEAEEAQRILLAALNGLAGLMILDSNRPQAVVLYRKVTAGPEACLPATVRMCTAMSNVTSIAVHDHVSRGPDAARL